MLANLARPVTASDLADVSGFSRFYFHRTFYRLMGETLGDMMRRLRLEAAAHWLHQTELSVGSIALECGFESHEGFTRAFRTEYGYSPSEFRAQAELRYERSTPNGVHFGWPIHPTLNPLDNITMEAQLSTFGPVRCAVMAHKGPYYLIGSTFGIVIPKLAQAGAQIGPGIAFYYDDPGAVKAEDLRSEAGCLVNADFTCDDESIRVFDIPAVQIAKSTHIGPYEQLGDAWEKFFASALPSLGVRANGQHCFELYLNDCNQVPPEELRTEICVTV